MRWEIWDDGGLAVGVGVGSGPIGLALLSLNGGTLEPVAGHGALPVSETHNIKNTAHAGPWPSGESHFGGGCEEKISRRACSSPTVDLQCDRRWLESTALDNPRLRALTGSLLAAARCAHPTPRRDETTQIGTADGGGWGVGGGRSGQA